MSEQNFAMEILLESRNVGNRPLGLYDNQTLCKEIQTGYNPNNAHIVCV